jgi:excisionase family DNA binding protein
VEKMIETVLKEISPDELKQLLAEVVAEELNRIKSKEPVQEDDKLIKIDEVSKLLNVSLVTIHSWKKTGKLPFYKISNKIYFKKSEILEALNKSERKN